VSAAFSKARRNRIAITVSPIKPDSDDTIKGRANAFARLRPCVQAEHLRKTFSPVGRVSRGEISAKSICFFGRGTTSRSHQPFNDIPCSPLRVRMIKLFAREFAKQKGPPQRPTGGKRSLVTVNCIEHAVKGPSLVFGIVLQAYLCAFPFVRGQV